MKRLLVVMGLLLVAFAVLANGTQESGTATDEDVTLTCWTDALWSVDVMSSFEDNWVYQQAEERTGIDIEWIHTAANEGNEQFNLLIASGDYPDMVIRATAALDGDYPGGADKAIEDGFTLRLNDLIDNYAPAYKAALNTDPLLAKLAKTDEGNIPAFYLLQLEPQVPHSGPTMRKDWLDELGYDIPETLDDWTQILRAFRDEKGAETPLLIKHTGIETAAQDYTGTFANAFGIHGGFYQEDGTVKYGPIEPGYADYVAFMKNWYDEGLIDPDFTTGPQWGGQQQMYWREEKCGATWETGFWLYNTFTTNARNEDGNESFEMVGVPFPKMNEDDTLHLRMSLTNIGYPGFITTACKNPEVAAEWFNFFYTDEGYILSNYGIEGVDFNYVDGKPVYTEHRKTIEDIPWVRIEQKYELHHTPSIRDWTRGFFAYGDVAVEAMYTWRDSAEADGVLMPLTYTSDEGRKRAAVMTDIETFVQEMTPKFIMGIEPLSDIDAFVAEIKKMGIDEAVSITQAALDRFNAR